MRKTIEHVHWPNAPDLWMPYAPAIKVKGGATVYLAGVTAAPVYHHHPHRREEFDNMPRDMEGQARAALDNLKRGLSAVGANFADIVTADRFVTDLSDQDALNSVWAEYFGNAKPATTTVQVVRLATAAAKPSRAASQFTDGRHIWPVNKPLTTNIGSLLAPSWHFSGLRVYTSRCCVARRGREADRCCGRSG